MNDRIKKYLMVPFAEHSILKKKMKMLECAGMKWQSPLYITKLNTTMCRYCTNCKNTVPKALSGRWKSNWVKQSKAVYSVENSMAGQYKNITNL